MKLWFGVGDCWVYKPTCPALQIHPGGWINSEAVNKKGTDGNMTTNISHKSFFFTIQFKRENTFVFTCLLSSLVEFQLCFLLSSLLCWLSSQSPVLFSLMLSVYETIMSVYMQTDRWLSSLGLSTGQSSYPSGSWSWSGGSVSAASEQSNQPERYWHVTPRYSSPDNQKQDKCWGTTFSCMSDFPRPWP